MLVAGQRRRQLGRGAHDGEGDDRRHQRRRGHDEREPLVRARRRATRAVALRRPPHRPSDRRGAALDTAPRPRASPGNPRRRRDARSPPTCSSGSSAPTRASARASSPPPPACSRVQQRRRQTAAANPNFDPNQFAAATDTIYITSPEHHQAVCAPLIVGLLGADPPRRLRARPQPHTRRATMLWAAGRGREHRPHPRPPRPRLPSRQASTYKS